MLTRSRPWSASDQRAKLSSEVTARAVDPEHRYGLENQVHEHDDRPWGSYDVLDDAASHKVKRIQVHPGARLSYQRHAHRAEHWVIVSGRATVTLDGEMHELTPGDAIDIPCGAAHRMSNPGTEPLVFVEVQLGSYFGEDDIERLEDDYGR